MTAKSKPGAPQHVVDAVEAGLRDIQCGILYDAKSVQFEAQQMLADHDNAHLLPAETFASRRPKHSLTE